jgi:hypothetical protein
MKTNRKELAARVDFLNFNFGNFAKIHLEDGASKHILINQKYFYVSRKRKRLLGILQSCECGFNRIKFLTRPSH